MRWQNAYSVIDSRTDASGLFSWSFDPLFPVDVRFYTYSKRKNLRLNRHDYFELMYLLQGRMLFQIQRQRYDLGPGDLIVIGSMSFHGPIGYGPPPTKAVVLGFLPDAVLGKDGNGEDLEYLMPFLAQDADFPHLVSAKTGIPAKILGLIQCVNAELPAKSVRKRLNAKTYLKMILVTLGDHYTGYRMRMSQIRRKEENIKRLRPVLEFLEKHFSEPIMVGDAAAIIHMSGSRFIRFFRNVTGQGFITYLNHLRIVRAEWLLAATDMPIAELCQEVGFCDQSYFGMVFRKTLGVTPGRYRRQFSGTLVDDNLKRDLQVGVQPDHKANSGLVPEERQPKAGLKQSDRMLMERGGFIQ